MTERPSREIEEGGARDAPPGPPPEPGPGPPGAREVFLHAPFGVALLSLDGRVMDANPASLAAHGRPRDAIVGHHIRELGPLFPEDVPRLEELFLRVAGGETLPPLEIRLRHADGTTRWVEARLVRLERDGRPWAVEALSHDVTRQKRAEAALRDSVERYRVLVDNAADAILLTRPDGTITEANPSAESLLGVPANELIERHVVSLIAPEDLVENPLRLHEIRAGRTVRLTRVFRRRDGHRVTAEMVARLLEDGRVMVVLRDTGARQEAERQLAESERRLRATIGAAPVVLFAVDAEGAFTFSEGRGLEKLGLLPGEVVGRSVYALYADVPEVGDAIRRALAGETVECGVTVGGLEWESRFAPIAETGGRVTGVIGVAWDVTERRTAERAVRRSETRYRALAEHSAVGIWQITPEGYTIYANPAMLGLLGLPDEQSLAGTTFHRFFTPDGLEAIRREQARRAEGQAGIYEATLRAATGESRQVVVSGAPIRDPAGRLLSLIGTFVDVTERRRAERERERLEQRVRQAEKLESLGLLAGGVAHDFNNLLTGVMGNAGLALARLEPGHPARPIVERIEQAARWAADLTRQLLAYAGRGRTAIRRLDLAELVREMSGVLESTVARDARLRFEIEATPSIEADPGQVRQLVLNLVQNAAEACPPGHGHVTVRVRGADVDASWLLGSWLGEGRQPGRYAVLEVRDDGVGMDRETQQSIFDPFFTTKPAGRGLGLAAVLGIIRVHGGAIRLDSRPGAGTTFQVLLPSAPSPTEDPMTPEPPSPGPPATVLVVDDEEGVRDMMKQALEFDDQNVIEAASGEEAITSLEAAGGAAHVVVLDANLEGLRGAALVERLRTLAPAIPVLLVSGDLEADVRLKFGGPVPTGVRFLSKPFTPKTLTQLVREMAAPA